MERKRSKTGNFTLPAGGGKLPTPEEIEQNLAKATGKEQTPQDTPPSPPKTRKRQPFTTALTLENRARLEAAARESDRSPADIVNAALEHYFQTVQPITDASLVDLFVKLYAK